MNLRSEELLNLIEVVDEYGRDFDVRFSSEKCKVMIINRLGHERETAWSLSGAHVEQIVRGPSKTKTLKGMHIELSYSNIFL